jgi:hypothetical protein
MTITDSYRTLADRVAPERMREYAANLSRADDVTGQVLTWTDAPEIAADPFLAQRLTIMALLLAAGLLFFYWPKGTPEIYRDYHLPLAFRVFAVVIATLWLMCIVDTGQGAATVVCTGLAAAAIMLAADARKAPEHHWLHPVRKKGRHARTVRDVLIGSSATLLLLGLAA